MAAERAADVRLPVLNRLAGVVRPGVWGGEARGEKCGVFGVWGDPGEGTGPARLAYFGLFSLQHRGQESAGIAVTDGVGIERRTGMGLVPQVFGPEDLSALDAVAGRRVDGGVGRGVGGAIGHNRYSTTGGSEAGNSQPFYGVYSGGPIAIAHNGNVTNASLIRRELQSAGHAFHATSDTEVMLQTIAAEGAEAGCDDPLASALSRFEGAFSVVLLHSDRVEAARDPWGWRPLCVGRMASGAWVVSSETIALDVIGAAFVRDVEPGEIVTLDDDGLGSRRFAEPAPRRAHCVFEHVYFASPASCVDGKTVQRVRERLGERLAEEAPVAAEVVMPMPDSGRSAATGFARASGIPYREGIIPNRYVGRTFIKPTSGERVDAVRLKLNVVSEVVKGHSVVVVDDSIVRGTTTRVKMDQLRAAGAREIHLRISCPPIISPCYFGVDFADTDQLVAANHSVEEIREMLGVDSLHYLSLDALLDEAEGGSCDRAHFCTACYSGEYRIRIEPGLSKEILAQNC